MLEVNAWQFEFWMLLLQVFLKLKLPKGTSNMGWREYALVCLSFPSPGTLAFPIPLHLC